MATKNVSFYGASQPLLGGKIQREYAPARNMAQSLMQAGGSMAPVQSWQEGMARALQGGIGGYLNYATMKAQGDREAAQSDAMAQALAGGVQQVLPSNEDVTFGSEQSNMLNDQTAGMFNESDMASPDQQAFDLERVGGGIQGVIDAGLATGNKDIQPFLQNAQLMQMNQTAAAKQAVLARTQKMEDFRKQLEIKKELGITDGSEPSSIREWNRFQKMTETEKSRYLTMKRAGSWLNTGESYVKPDPLDPNAPPQVISIKPKETDTPSFKAAVKKAEGKEERALKLQTMFPKARGALQTLESKSGLVADTIDKALGYIDAGFATGIASNLSYVPWETDAAKLKNDLMTIKANIGFDRLQEMRDNSVTGGALGAINKSEMELLQAVNGALDPTQGSQLVENLKKIKRIYPALLAKTRLAYETDFNSILNPASTNSLPPPPLGYN
tara:strand:+ start:165 stop:1493 length:1329 start_codon:yes stop_codon:yes gene_type:complete